MIVHGRMGSLNQALAGKQVYLDVNIFIYALEGMEPWASLLRHGTSHRAWLASGRAAAS